MKNKARGNEAEIANIARGRVLYFSYSMSKAMLYSTAQFKLDDTRVQQLHGSTHFQKCSQHFLRAHDRPMTYYHWKLHACMHEMFILLACAA